MRSILFLLFFLGGCAGSVEPARQPAEAMAISAKPVPLDASDPGRSTLGRLRYLGGIELASDDKSFGAFSSLKWHDGRLFAVNDIGGWTIFSPVEREGKLEGVRALARGGLLGPDGSRLAGSATGDAEAFDWDGKGWLAGFEHDHRILRFPRLGRPGEPTAMDPQTIFGPLKENNGIEAIAVSGDRLFLCVERLATEQAPHCFIRSKTGSEAVRIPVPAGLDPAAGFPTDADWGADGTLYILFRSWSGGPDNRGAIVARSPDGALSTLATFVRPVAVDNFEGLALREEQGRTYFYIVSDNNFGVYNPPGRPHEWQRTLLLKFELIR